MSLISSRVKRAAASVATLALAALAAGLTTSGGTGTGAVAGAQVPGTAAPSAGTPSPVLPTLVWQQILPAGVQVTQSSPNVATLVGGPSVVVGASDGKLYAYHLADGSAVPGWPAKTSAPIVSSPAVTPMTKGRAGDEVVIGSGTASTDGHGGLSAYGPNGQQLWNRLTPSPPYNGVATKAVVASPVIGQLGNSGPLVATAGTLGQAYYSVNAATGAVVPGWPYTYTDSVFSSPALAVVPNGSGVNVIEGGDASPGILVDQIQGGFVRALKADGTLSWEYHVDDDLTSSPVVGSLSKGAAPEIVIGGGDYWLRTAGLPTDTSMDITVLSMMGKPLWRLSLGGITIDAPALADLTGNGQTDILEGIQKGSDDKVGGAGSGLVWALNPEGQALAGWPVDPVPGSFVVGQVSTADLYATGQQDVLVPTAQGLFAYSPQGQLLWHLARGADSPGSVNGNPVVLANSPLVTVDPNGSLGITIAGYVGATGQGVIEHFELPGGQIGTGAWPMWRHDPAHTANTATSLSMLSLNR